jgi:phage shock protein E
MDNRLLIALIVIAIVFFLVKRGGQISAQQAAELLAKGALIIDVRSPQEFASGSLPKAQNLPLDQIKDRIPSVAPDKNQPILLHCLSGTRSGMAKSRLQGLGYTNVHNLGSYSRASSILQPGGT